MAFLSKVGNDSLFALRLSIYQAVRCISSSKVFVSGISSKINDASLKNDFSSYGPVVQARVITERGTGKSKGFGFVTFDNVESASKAIHALNGKNLHGKRVRVSYATDRAPSTTARGDGGYGSKVYGSVGGDDAGGVTERV